MSNKNNHIEFNDMVIRYLAGEMTVSERKMFETEVEPDAEKQKILKEYQKIWEGLDSVAGSVDYDLDAEWGLIEGKLEDSSEAKMGTTRSIGFFIYRIAAIIVFGLIISTGWYFGNRSIFTEMVAMESGTELIELPDGSTVTLNRGSKIRYYKKSDRKERKVFLTGEAYFEVERDTMRPFIIDAGETMIKVLGTSFNVNAYGDNEKIEITVNTGLVAFSAKRTGDKQIVLKAGNTGTYDKNSNELILQTAGNPNALSWKTGKISFENTPLSEAVLLINKIYQTNLVIVNQELINCPITVTFNNQSLSAIMNVLQSTLDIEFNHVGDHIEIEGSGCYE